MPENRSHPLGLLAGLAFVACFVPLAERLSPRSPAVQPRASPTTGRDRV